MAQLSSRLCATTLIALFVMWVSTYSATLNTYTSTLLYVVVPLAPVVLSLAGKDVFSPVWSEHVVSRIKYGLFVLQAILLIYSPLVFTDEQFTRIVIFFVGLNVLLVGVDQFKSGTGKFRALYLIPPLYLIHQLLDMRMVQSERFFYVAENLDSKFVIDYTLWFLMYPKTEKRFGILAHTIAPLVCVARPEMWIVVRSFAGSVVLFLTYTAFGYRNLIESRAEAGAVATFRRVYVRLYAAIFVVGVLAELTGHV